MRAIKFVPGHFYHIYNRGVDKRNIFRDETDRWRCLQGLCLFNDEKNSSNILWQIEKSRGEVNLKILKDYLIKEGKKPIVHILAYSLMPNHYHLLVKEFTAGGITKFMHKFGGGYTRYFNNKHSRSGSLFEGSFKAVQVDNEIYLQYLLVYINVINPGQLIEPKLKDEGIKDVTALVNAVDGCPWTTHQEYSGNRGSIIIDEEMLNEFFSTPEKYRDFVWQVLADKKYQAITHLTIEKTD